MAFEFRPAKRENVGLLIGLAGGTGSGKTYTAMRLATGIAGDRPFAVIDTEAGRAKHYADYFRFDHGDLGAPFKPSRYLEAIQAADAAGYPAIVVDSMSHEHEGPGGVLEWHDEELARLGGQDSKTFLAWQPPKKEHRQMVQALLQLRAHVILCFRAAPKIEIARVEGKTVVREKTGLNVMPGGWTAITDAKLMFELTASMMFMAERPGVPMPIKLQEQHRAFFPLDQVVTEATGAAVAAWARGGEVNWVAKIEQVKTREELGAIGRDLTRIKPLMTAPAREIAVAAYNHRLKELTDTKPVEGAQQHG
jgi:hypothetical protein